MFENILVEEVRFPRQISAEARDLLGGLLVKVILFGAATFSATAVTIMTASVVKFIIMTFSIMAVSVINFCYSKSA
jgi:hypothetical protein